MSHFILISFKKFFFFHFHLREYLEIQGKQDWKVIRWSAYVFIQFNNRMFSILEVISSENHWLQRLWHSSISHSAHKPQEFLHQMFICKHLFLSTLFRVMSASQENKGSKDSKGTRCVGLRLFQFLISSLYICYYPVNSDQRPTC